MTTIGVGTDEATTELQGHAQDYTGMTFFESSSCDNFLSFVHTATLILIVVGTVGNVLTLIMLWKETRKSESMHLLFWISVTDLFIVLSNGFLIVIPRILTVGITQKSITISIVYGLLAYVSRVTRLSNVYLVVAVTWQRFAGAILPFSVKKWRKKFNSGKQLVVIMLFSLAYNMPFIIYFRCRVIELPDGLTFVSVYDEYPSEKFKFVYENVVHNNVYFALPLLSLVIMTAGLICYFLQKGQSSVIKKSMKVQQREATVSVLLVVIIFIICQCLNPARKIALLYYTDPESSKCGGPVYYLNYILPMSILLNSSCNIFIYIICIKRFRARIKSMFCCQLRIAPHQTTSTYIGTAATNPQCAT